MNLRHDSRWFNQLSDIIAQRQLSIYYSLNAHHLSDRDIAHDDADSIGIHRGNVDA